MAVSLTRAALAVQLRIVAAETDTVPDGQAAVLDRVLATSTAMVEKFAPEAPDAVQNDAAAALVAGRLYDTAGHEARGGNPMLQSGAAYVLSLWRPRRLKAADGSGVGRL